MEPETSQFENAFMASQDFTTEQSTYRTQRSVTQQDVMVNQQSPAIRPSDPRSKLTGTQ